MATFNISAVSTFISGPTFGTVNGTFTPAGIGFTYSFTGGRIDLDVNMLQHDAVTRTTSTPDTIPTFNINPIPVTATLALTGNNFFSNVTLPALSNISVSAITTGGNTVAMGNGVPFAGNVTGLKFTFSPGAELDLTSIMSNAIACFCAGTRIATVNGPRAVEALQAGDILVLADGSKSPLTWLGRQPVSATFADPARFAPVCISAGALGAGLPEQDLYLSPDHAVEIDGVLYNAGALINGTTIRSAPERMRHDFIYYHVQTEAHALLVAEGLAAESYIDQGDLKAFENGDEAVDHATAPMALPRVSSARLVPQNVRDRISPKAAA